MTAHQGPKNAATNRIFGPSALKTDSSVKTIKRQRNQKGTGEQAFAPDASRVALLFGGLQMIRDHPLFGVGPQRIHSEFPRYYSGTDLSNFYYGHLENNIVQIGAERGLLCLAAFFWFIFELYASLVAMLRTTGESTRWIVLSALAALTGFMVAGLFEYNFGDSEVLLLFLFIVSIPYGLRTGEAADV